LQGFFCESQQAANSAYIVEVHQSDDSYIGDVSVTPKKNDIDKTGINDDIERYEQQSITGKRQKPKKSAP